MSGLVSGLQNHARRFESARHLCRKEESRNSIVLLLRDLLLRQTARSIPNIATPRGSADYHLAFCLHAAAVRSAASDDAIAWINCFHLTCLVNGCHACFATPPCYSGVACIRGKYGGCEGLHLVWLKNDRCLAQNNICDKICRWCLLNSNRTDASARVAEANTVQIAFVRVKTNAVCIYAFVPTERT